MNPDYTVGSEFETEACIVCRKSAEFGGGTVRIQRGGAPVNLCGPDCMAVFARDPDSYLARLAKTQRESALRAEVTEGVRP